MRLEAMRGHLVRRRLKRSCDMVMRAVDARIWLCSAESVAWYEAVGTEHTMEGPQ
jgi:hypothetical protein